MKTPEKNTRGTTLVELIVCMALLGIFAVSAIALIQPCAETFTEMQRQTRAQNLADAVLESLRGELMQATGYLRLSDASTETQPTQVFEQGNATDHGVVGTAVEFMLDSGYIELIDAGYVPKTRMTYSDKEEGTTPPTGSVEEKPPFGPLQPGQVHLRYLKPYTAQRTDSEGKAYNVQLPEHADEKHTPNGQKVYNHTELYPDRTYMDMTVELTFYLRGTALDTVKNTPVVSSLTVQAVVRSNVKKTDGSYNVLCVQKSIIPLPHQPEFIWAPGWRGPE